MAIDKAKEKLAIIGESRALKSCLQKLEKVRLLSGNVLLLGESGAGKDWLARLLYYGFDSRAVRVLFPGDEDWNLKALPPTVKWLHIRGLDILSPEQVRSLLALLEKRVKPRIVATAKADLIAKMQRGHFAADLFHRLAEHQIVIPPLRERRSDMPLLIQHFLAEWNRTTGQGRKFLPRAVQYLLSLYWTGNLTQLKNSVQQVLAETEEELIGEATISQTSLPLSHEKKGFLSLKHQVDRARREHIEAVIRYSSSIRKAARALEVSPQSLLRYMKELNIKHSPSSEDLN